MVPKSVWALVPVKPLHEAKSRLACVLSPQERVDLVCALLTRTLHVLVNCSALAGVLVVSADAQVGELATACGADYLAEPPPCDLNLSLDAARTLAMQRGADGVLIVPADLPCIDGASIEAVLDAASEASMSIVPDRHREGTNCLFITPPDAIPLLFGEQSMSRHIAAAQSAEINIVVVEDLPLSLDVDRPDDLEIAVYCLKPVA